MIEIRGSGSAYAGDVGGEQVTDVLATRESAMRAVERFQRKKQLTARTCMCCKHSFMSEGALDLGANPKFFEGFIRIFAGEMEALIAIEHAGYLGSDRQRELMRLAAPTVDSFEHFKNWKQRILR